MAQRFRTFGEISDDDVAEFSLALPRSELPDTRSATPRHVGAVAAGTAIACAGLAGARMAVEGAFTPVVASLSFVALAAACSPIVYRLTGAAAWAGATIPAAALLGGTAMAWADGGLLSDVVPWFPLFPFVAGLLVGGRAAIPFGVAGVVAIASLVVQHALDGVFSGPDAGRWALRSMGVATAVGFGAFLGWVYERGRTESDARERSVRERATQLLRAMPDLVVGLGAEGRLLEIDVPAGARLPVPVEPYLNRVVWELLPPELAEPLREQVERARATRHVESREYDLDVFGAAYTLTVRAVRASDTLTLLVVADATDARAAQRTKDDFISVVSHELRTPLAGIHGSLKMMDAAALPVDKRGELLEVARRNSERLRLLIDDILDAQRIESGRIEYAMTTLDLEPWLRDTARAVEALGRPRSVRVTLGAVPAATVTGDPNRLAQVIDNLVSNAVRYSPEGGRVRIDAQLDGDEVTIRVADEGPGIPAAFQSRVFDRFAQAEGGSTRRAGGTGLGLWISSRIVQAHDGRIWFDTSDRGTTFHVALPRESAQTSRVPTT